MAISDLNNIHLTESELAAIDTALTQLEKGVEKIDINLTPEERQKYGSINEQNKLFVNKVYDYNKSQPNLSSPDVDWVEFEKDFKSRQELEMLLARLEKVKTALHNAKTLYDYDNYQGSLSDYAYTNYKFGTSTPGFEAKLNALKQFFIKTFSKKKTPPENSEEKS